MAQLQQFFSAVDLVQMPPAQLWIGRQATLHTHALAYLQHMLCAHKGCGVCMTCSNIANHSHYALTWIAPEERYTLDTLTPIIQTLAFALDDDQHHIFVIERADMLTPACANSLLKSIEEPSRGYHFLLLAQSVERVMPTIRSRCLVTTLETHNVYNDHPLLACFMQTTPVSPTTFAKLLETNKSTEQETADLLDQLLHFLLDQAKKALVGKNSTSYKQMQSRLACVKSLCSRPVMPGSSKLIWRELFLEFYQ